MSARRIGIFIPRPYRHFRGRTGWPAATSSGVLALIPALLLSQVTKYTIDPAETELVALTKPAGLFGGASHPHVIVAQRIVGEIVYDPATPETSSVTISFRADALDNDEPRLRERFKLKSTISPEDRKAIGTSMRSEDQLDVARFPTVRFTSRKVAKLDALRLEVFGTMTLRGVAVELTLPVTVSVKDGVFRGQGSVGVTHAMFGFKPFSTALGAIRNAEEINLELRITANAVGADGGR